MQNEMRDVYFCELIAMGPYTLNDDHDRLAYILDPAAQPPKKAFCFPKE